MDLSLNPYYEKDGFIIDTNIPFYEDGDFEAIVHKYFVRTGFNLMLVDDDYNETNDIVATIKAVFLRYDNIRNDVINFIDAVDTINTPYTDDIVRAVTTLINSQLLPKEQSRISLICYLSRVYVYSKFRNKGVANYIFENLQEIFEYITGEQTNLIIIYPQPQEPSGDRWHNVEDEEMKQKMISKLEQNYFKPISDTGFYFKLC